jgi:endonuclease/exonuclease/phosphatase family metal-dependent hydrolase
VEACRHLDADVIVLQEIYAPLDGASQSDDIAAALDYTPVELPLARAWRRREPILHGKRWEPRKVLPTTMRALRVGGRVDHSKRSELAGYEEGTWGIAVLSRPRVVTTEAIALGRLKRDFTHRGALVVDLEVGTGNEGEFTVVGTHAAHLTVGSPMQIRRLYRELPTTTRPAAFVGDMNMWGPPLSLLLPGWTRAVRGRTWPAWRPHSQTDHILVNRPVTVVRGEVVHAGNSDHLAVRAELRW